MLTSGISAEYGRFSGGVINVVTKRGGDIFSGSFRTTLSNPSWQNENPFEESSGVTHRDRLGKVYEGTFGGPILRSKVWFFSSGRYEDSLEPQTLRESGTPYNLGVTNTRGQIKLTGAVWQGHTVSGSYMNNATEQRDRPGVASVDARSLDPVRTQPNDLLVVNWQGVLSSRLFGTAQVSRKHQRIEGSGVQLNGNYTARLRSEGNFEGEARNQPGLTSTFGDYPETLSPRNNPTGRFDDYQRHKVRMWGIYTLDLRRLGALDLSALYSYNSALTFSYAATSVPLSASQLAAGAGYEGSGRGRRKPCSSVIVAAATSLHGRRSTWASTTPCPCCGSCVRTSRWTSSTCSTTSR